MPPNNNPFDFELSKMDMMKNEQKNFCMSLFMVNAINPEACTYSSLCNSFLMPILTLVFSNEHL